jgi:DNA-binding transcriptional ArsR family regulator
MSDRLGRLLLHPLRHRLLLEYAGEPDSPGRVAARLGEALNLVAYHTGVLRRRGYVELVRTERRHGALTHFYRSAVGPVIDATQWESLPITLRRSLVLETLELIGAEARQAALAGGFDPPAAHVSRVPLELDAQGLTEVAHLLDDADAAIARIAAAARERASAPYQVAVLSFEPADGTS